MSLVNRSRAVATTEPKQKSHGCSAHGCPLAGAIADTSRPGDATSWFCRFHFGAKADDWQSITQWIRGLDHETLRTAISPPTRLIRHAA